MHQTLSKAIALRSAEIQLQRDRLKAAQPQIEQIHAEITAMIRDSSFEVTRKIREGFLRLRTREVSDYIPAELLPANLNDGMIDYHRISIPA